MPSIADRNHRASLIGNARLGHWEPRRRQMVLTAAEKRRISEHIVVDRRTGCWLWDGISDRYGEISFRGIPTKAHRLMLQLLLDEALPIDAHVHHECERRGCVNPDHLRLLKPGDHRKRHTAGVGRRS